jgi:hypothetical protein
MRNQWSRDVRQAHSVSFQRELPDHFRLGFERR